MTSDLHAKIAAVVPELRSRALRLCGDPATADDVVQDAVERALRFHNQYEPGTNLRAWAFRILYSVFVTRWRRRRRERHALECLACDPCAWTTQAPLGPSDALTPAMRRKLDALPPPFRDTLVLVILDGRSYRDAATELAIPVGTVMSRLHRARKLLAAEMAGTVEEREAA